MEIDRKTDLSMMDRSINSPAYSSRSGTSKRVVGRQTHLSTKREISNIEMTLVLVWYISRYISKHYLPQAHETSGN